MDPQFEGLTEDELRKMLDAADDYDHRSKIRAAIRILKKGSGLGGRKATGTSVYRRPGFQTPRSVQIPNSVTGNVLPSSVKDGEPVKPPDKTTPTISYLNAKTTVSKSPKRAGSNSSSQGQFGVAKTSLREEEKWWNKSQSSSRSQTPSDTSEQRQYSERSESEDHVFPETQKEPTPEPPKEPTPEPPKEPTPSPEPLHEPTPSPEPVHEPTPSPEPVHEPTPSPEPVHEPTPSPEPVHEPTPSPEPVHEPSPEPIEERVPSPEQEAVEESHLIEPTSDLEEDKEGSEAKEEEEEEEYSDGEDDELQALEEESYKKSSQQAAQVQLVNKSLPIDVLQEVEPGLEEKKDFRTVLRKAEDTKIDTKAAFPSQKPRAEQVDFRNVLKKTSRPEKKSFKVEQVDFREKLKPKEKTDDSKEQNVIEEDKVTVEEDDREDDEEEASQQEEKEEKLDVPEEKSVAVVLEEDSYEVRRETRRREREEREKQLADFEKQATETTENGIEDSYEARREARRKAREARKQQEKPEEKSLTYREKQQIEQAKRTEENKKKWASMDQANSNGNGEKPISISRQKSTQSGPQQLLAWCQYKTKYYENVEVKDFSHSFANGLALCAILHSFMPDDIPYDDLSPNNPTENFTVALQLAEDIGIGSFFDVEDLIAVKAPDPKSMMTFLATIYKHFK